MDLNPKQQAFWRFLSLTVYNIHIESNRANPNLRRLVILINTLDANIGRNAGSRSPDNNLEVTTLECKGQDHKRTSTERDDIKNDTKGDEADDFDGHQDLREAESPNGGNDPFQSDSDTGQAYRLPKHRHTGDNTTWQAYRGSCATYAAPRANQLTDIVPACFALPSIAEDDEEDRSNDYGPVEAIDVGQATVKYYHWTKEKAACCCVSVEDVSEAGELYF
jgi:hypothetical protein